MRIGPYEVLGEIGRGGMGVVYRVRTASGSEAALKLLRRLDAAALASFEREQRLLASLGEREGFVGLLDSGTSPSGPWLLMPLLGGGTLRKRLEAGPLGAAETLDIGVALATALGAAHARGIVHRDVKPENVLFTATGRALVADLGLAKHFDRSAPGGSQSLSLSSQGTLKGTAGYMAPEQIVAPSTVGPPADVFALGAVLYECLSGAPAFQGATPLEVFAKVGSGVFEPLGREVPRWLEDVVGRALEVDARARFADGASFARALSRRGKKAPSPGKRRLAVALAVGAALGVLVLAAALAHSGPAPRASEKPAPPPPAPSPALVPPPAPAGSALAFLARGKELVEAHDSAGAIPELTRSIELDPGHALAWYLRGLARGESGDLDGAIDDLTRALDLDARHAQAWLARGRMREKKRDMDGAIADETRAVELDPRLAAAWESRGVARGNKRDLQGLIADETKAIELDPRVSAPWLDRAVGRGKLEDWQGMIADLANVLELEPKKADVWNMRGYARIQMKDWDGAISDLDRAIELDPERVSSWFRRGTARGAKGDAAGNVADFEHCLELDPHMEGADEIRRVIARGKKALAR